MKSIDVLALLLPTAFGLVAKPDLSGVCTSSPTVVSSISNPSGSKFCASLLHISHATKTKTTTIQPKTVTVTRTARTTIRTATVTQTVNQQTTTTSTRTQTTQGTATVTHFTNIYLATDVSCISDTNQLSPYPTTLSSSAVAKREEIEDEYEDEEDEYEYDEDATLEKRGRIPPALQPFYKPRRSAFCSCLSLKPSTTTQTIRSRVPRKTVTSFTTQTVSAKTITKTSSTKTFTKTVVSTLTMEPTTTTVTEAMVTPTPSSYAGVNYYVFLNDYDYGNANPGFDATTWQSNDYRTNGIITEINDEHTVSGNNFTCVLPGGDFDRCDQSTIVNQGYLHAIVNGTYTVASGNDIDNGMYVWSGQNAYNGYNNNNEDYQAVRAGGGPYYGGSYEYPLNAGDLHPFTIMAVNGGGPGTARLFIESPDGTTTGSDGHFIPACPKNNPFSP